MVAATALILGHTAGGDLTSGLFLAVALRGGLLGGRLSLKTSPQRLKRIFAYSTPAAAMVVGAKIAF